MTRPVLLSLVLAAAFSLAHCGDAGPAGSPTGNGVSLDAGPPGRDASVAAGGDSSPATPPGPDAPPITPTLLVSTYLGGAGDQYISDVHFDAQGNIVAVMGGATVTYDAAALHGTTSGDVAPSMDMATFPIRYPLPQGGLSTNRLTDPRNGQTYTWGTHPNVGHGGTLCPSQCKGECTPGDPQPGLLQMAFLSSSAGWKLWDYAWDPCVQQCVVADSRGYDLFPLAGNQVGMMLWTDGGDTPLRRDPTDVTKPATFTDGSFGEDPGGMGTLFARIDPTSGVVSGGTWLATHAVFHATDPWGRVYVTKALPIRYGKSDQPQPANPFGMSPRAESGLFVLRADFKQPETHFYLGGDPASCGANGVQSFDAVALRDNVLALAGTTCVTDLKTTSNAVQAAPGGAQDGFLVVLKLWN